VRLRAEQVKVALRKQLLQKGEHHRGERVGREGAAQVPAVEQVVAPHALRELHLHRHGVLLLRVRVKVALAPADAGRRLAPALDARDYSAAAHPGVELPGHLQPHPLALALAHARAAQQQQRPIGPLSRRRRSEGRRAGLRVRAARAGDRSRRTSAGSELGGGAPVERRPQRSVHHAHAMLQAQRDRQQNGEHAMRVAELPNGDGGERDK